MVRVNSPPSDWLPGHVMLSTLDPSRFVKLQYEPVHSLDELAASFKRQTGLSEGNEFIEALMFSKDEGVVMTGCMVSCADRGKVRGGS